MRQLAAFCLETALGAGATPAAVAAIESIVDAWLRSKGTHDQETGIFTLADGRIASVEKENTSSREGELHSYTLNEPIAGAFFRTDVAIARHEETLGVAVSLSATTPDFSPTQIEVRRPRLVADLLGLPYAWRVRGTEISAAPRRFQGAAGGDEFTKLVWSVDRAVPVVSVSSEYGAVLHPGIVEKIASDLAGVAIVTELDVEASWRLTARKGREWSCFGGAVRIFWPFTDLNKSPFLHSLWTPQRLLADVVDTEAAAERIRAQLRRRVFAQAAFAISEPSYFNLIRAAARSESLQALKASGSSSEDRAMAEEWFNKSDSLARQLEAKEEEIRDLRAQLRNAQAALLFSGREVDDLAPASSAPPSTVEEAVLEAMEQFADELTFGADVNEGIQGLARDAGPPEKILKYLGILAEFTRARRKGSLGDTAVKWINRQGATCSGESYTIQNSASSVSERTWEDGSGGRRYFDLHLKPADQTSPDRCVRIYFEYDDVTAKTIVGWVGRKPGL